MTVQGSSLSADVLQAAYAPYVGTMVRQADLTKLADAVGRAYASSDVALYTVLLPNQDFADGALRLRVIEGYISAVEIRPQTKGQKTRLIEDYAEALRAEQPLRRRTLERYLSLTRDIPGAKIDPQFVQGDAPGAVKLVVGVKQRRLELGASINNRGSVYLGRTQVQLQGIGNSLLRQGDQTVLTVSAPTELKRFQYVSLVHSQPIAATGATLSVNAGSLRTKPDFGNLDLSGTATVAGVQLAYPVLRSYSQNLYLTAGLDGLNSDNALFGRRISNERTRAIRVGGAYNRLAPTRTVTLNATVSHGLDALGARIADPLMSKADFNKVSLQAGLNQSVGKSWVVRLAAGGQLSQDRLPASEQFSIGGGQFGRAFPASEGLGDSGFGASVEVAFRPGKGLPKSIAGSEVYAFADTAEATMGARTRLPERNMDLASAGVGLRLAVLSKAVIEVETAEAVREVRPRQGGRALADVPQLPVDVLVTLLRPRLRARSFAADGVSATARTQQQLPCNGVLGAGGRCRHQPIIMPETTQQFLILAEDAHQAAQAAASEPDRMALERAADVWRGLAEARRDAASPPNPPISDIDDVPSGRGGPPSAVL